MAAIAWPEAPERIPIHWGFTGEPDNYTGKIGLFYLPLIMLGVYVLLLFLPRIDPRRASYEKFKGSYTVIRMALVITFFCIQIFTVLWVFDVIVNMNVAVPIIIGILLMVLGNYFGKFRPNWFTGIKTPWTLSSTESWNKTHRLGGRLFVVLGLLMVVAAPFQETWLFISLGVFLGIIIVTLYVYSYVIWKKDPQKVTESR